jgi:S-adenosylmethionine/arginine decarboxylase-like enzyme
MKPFGRELLIDIYNCNVAKIDDLNVVYNFLEEAVKVLDVSEQAPPFVFHSPAEFPDKAGISAWVPLIESAITCHTLTLKHFVTIDFYTCGKLTNTMRHDLIELATKTFGGDKVESQFVLRGIEYFRND